MEIGHASTACWSVPEDYNYFGMAHPFDLTLSNWRTVFQPTIKSFAIGASPNPLVWTKAPPPFFFKSIAEHRALTSLALAIHGPLTSQDVLQAFRRLELLHLDIDQHTEVTSASCPRCSPRELQEKIADEERISNKTVWQLCQQNPALRSLVLVMPLHMCQVTSTRDGYLPEMKFLVEFRLATRSATLSWQEVQQLQQRCPVLKTLHFVFGPDPVSRHRTCLADERKLVIERLDEYFGRNPEAKDWNRRYIKGRDLMCEDAPQLLPMLPVPRSATQAGMVTLPTMVPEEQQQRIKKSVDLLPLVRQVQQIQTAPSRTATERFLHLWSEIEQEVVREAMAGSIVQLRLPRPMSWYDELERQQQVTFLQGKTVVLRVPHAHVAYVQLDPKRRTSRYAFSGSVSLADGIALRAKLDEYVARVFSSMN